MKGRYLWMKLDRDFFRQDDILILRENSAGDMTVIIYLKLILAAMNLKGMVANDADSPDMCRRLAARIGETEEDTRKAVDLLVMMQRLEYRGNELTVADIDRYVGAKPPAM